MKIVYRRQENLTEHDNIIEETEVGTYGRKWVDFMQKQHPKLVCEMQSKGTLYKVAHLVDDTAWEYRELLDSQYAQAHPRPKEFYEVVAWERTRMFYTDSAVMREKVLIPYTSV